ncbi:MAG: hypothetical protein AB7V57_20050 [Verrucomicrobiales bacterium]
MHRNAPGRSPTEVLSDGPAFVALLKEGSFEAAKQLGPGAYEALQIAAGGDRGAGHRCTRIL